MVIERDTGRVLAMASSPGYDPNLFDPDNYNNILLPDVLSDPNQPLLNRATQGEYPLGSVFKIITMAAGLESGVFTPESELDCQYDWTELTDIPRHDWTWQHCEDEKLEDPEGKCTTKPSGLLTLPEGLMRSCNPWFWHIGLGLYDAGLTADIANMARAFGLGSRTGIEIPESAGTIHDPGEQIAAVNQAIGQGDVLVTPLQVARFIAAIGNGGTLYRPQIIERITNVSGQDTQVFKPEAQGHAAHQPREPGRHPGSHARRGLQSARHRLLPPERHAHPGLWQDRHRGDQPRRTACLVRRLHRRQPRGPAGYRRGGGARIPGRRLRVGRAGLQAHRGQLRLRQAAELCTRGNQQYGVIRTPAPEGEATPAP